jgi:hypothetical protein
MGVRSHGHGSKAEVSQGTLDLLVLKTLDTLGRLLGYGVWLWCVLVPKRPERLAFGHALCPVDNQQESVYVPVGELQERRA